MYGQSFRAVLALALLFVAVPVLAQQGGWRDDKSTLIPNTETRKSAGGFAGSILVTPDQDWSKKWNTPGKVTPRFPEAGTIPRGKKVWVLIFFANPKLDADGNSHITCDLRFVKPDGSVSFDKKGMTCFKGRLGGDPHLVYLASPAEFVGDPGDPQGTWRVAARVRDVKRGTELTLLTAFTLRN